MEIEISMKTAKVLGTIGIISIIAVIVYIAVASNCFSTMGSVGY
jgi:hypothetical protein